MRVSRNLNLLRRFFNLLNVDSEFKMCEDFLSEVFRFTRFLVINQFYGIYLIDYLISFLLNFLG